MEERKVEHIKSIKNSESLKGCLRDYLRNTGCHGCNKLEDGHTLRRWIWTICILVSLGVLIQMLYKELVFYYSYPTITQFDYELMEIADFPAVTICNTSPWSRKKLPPDSKMENFFESTYFGVLGPKMNWSDPYYRKNGFFQERTVDDIWKFARDQRSLFVFGKFDGEYFNTTANITKTMTNFGPCFSFNIDGRIKTKLDGELFNLLLFIYVNQSDYTWSSSLSAGIKFVIHDPSRTANFDTEAVYVQPGTYTSVKISETRTKFLPHPYQFSKGKYCVDTKYDEYLCYMQCYANYIFNECKCRDAKDHIDGPICSWYRYQTCWFPMRAKIMTNKTYAEECVCPTPCSSTYYDISISASQLISDYYGQKASEILKRHGVEFDVNLRDFIGLKIYFKSLRRTVIRQVSRYASVEEVLANLGGQMGLLLGASILTLTEFIEMLLFMLNLLVKRLCRRQLKHSNADQR